MYISSFGKTLVITVCHEDIYGATAYKKGLHFLLSRTNKLNHDFFQGQMLSLVCPPEKPRHRFHPISP